MDSEAQETLAQLIRSRQTASLGTLQNDAPLVSMVMYAASPDFAEFYIHISQLAVHTQNIIAHPQVSLMICEPESGSKNPQTLARISILGGAEVISADESEYEAIRSRYLDKYPPSAFNFQLGDFLLYRIKPQSARFVAGFGKIFNVTPKDISKTAEL